MPRNLSRRLSAAFVVIALLGLSLPVSALSPEGPAPGLLSRIQGWIDSVLSLMVPAGVAAPGHAAAPPIGAIGMDSTSNPDRGALIDPNGGSGR